MKLYLLVILLSLTFYGSSQTIEYKYYGNLKVDFQKIINQSSNKKTIGECMVFLQDEINKIIKRFGKESGEYIYLKKFYLDYLGRNFKLPDNYCYTDLNKEYQYGREELLKLTRNQYGEKSILYSDAIGYYVMNFTSLCSNSLDANLSKKLLNLYDTAISILIENKSIDTNDINILLPLYYGGKGNIYYKINKLDSSIVYYKEAIEFKEKHQIFDDFFPPLIGLYSLMINTSKGESGDGLNFMKKYVPLIKEKYKKNPERYYNYLCTLLDLAIISNNIGKGNTVYLIEAEELCKNVFGEFSNEYLNFALNKKLGAVKKLGWKSGVFKILQYLDLKIIGSRKIKMSKNNFINYYWEWYKYFQSINEVENGVKYLMYVKKFIENDTSELTKSEVIFKRTIFDEMSSYYKNRNFDSCLLYLLKALDLEIKSKAKFGNYVIHEYLEIAKYYIGFNDTNLANKGLKYCNLALDEFEKAYGNNNDYYKSALYTKGNAEYIINKGEIGFEKMHPFVYCQLTDTNFVPPYNISIFQSYAKILNDKEMYDSSDMFFNVIYFRNPLRDFFGVLGMSQSLQNKSLNEFYEQNYFILSQHLNRFLKNRYNYVSKELAENLFKKNLIFKLQKEEEVAIRFYSKNDSLIKTIKNSKYFYDSLVFNNIENNNLIDSFYSVYETNKSWALENYKLKKANLSETSTFTYDSVIKQLNKNECLIDIVRFTSGEVSDKKAHYATIIIDKFTNQKLKYIFFNDGELIEKYVKSNNLTGLNDLLIPLIGELKDYNKIFINPDGIFNLINFYSLKDIHNKYLIETKTIQYLNSLEGVNPESIENNKSKSYHKAVFFGDPNFSKKQLISENRSTLFDGYNFGALKELPYTRVEINEAMDVLNSGGWLTQSFFRNNCCENKFSQNTDYDIIHIATHGFYYNDSAESKSGKLFYNNPYLRSGLIFGLKEKNNNNKFDNILTAHEVFDYDLNKTSLVVLSACESARGESNPGQGLYGIQRAFKIAGAKNVLVSTRKVNDKATKMLMSFFYSHVAKGVDYVNAFRSAQLEMLRNPLIEDVNYWNGFLLIGE